MIHARVFAAVGAAECGFVAASLCSRDFMAEQFLPGQSATEWGAGFGVAAVMLLAAAVAGTGPRYLMSAALLAACGLHAAFGAAFVVYAATQGTSWVGATLAVFAALMYAREVLRLGGHPW